MARGSKAKYSAKQKRQARHIEAGYEKRGVGEKEAARRAWATVNDESGGGEKSGSGRGKPKNTRASKKGGKLGGKAAAKRSPAAKTASAKKAAATRKRKAAKKTPKRKALAKRKTAAKKAARTRAKRKSG